jgi:putative addiction module CopG family antidote
VLGGFAGGVRGCGCGVKREFAGLLRGVVELQRENCKCPITWPADVDARVQAQLATGEFPSADDVLREALNALEGRQQSLQRLREMVREAEDDLGAGRVGYFDADATLRAVAVEGNLKEKVELWSM